MLDAVEIKPNVRVDAMYCFKNALIISLGIHTATRGGFCYGENDSIRSDS